jgi:hypothetical protein
MTLAGWAEAQNPNPAGASRVPCAWTGDLGFLAHALYTLATERARKDVESLGYRPSTRARMSR